MRYPQEVLPGHSVREEPPGRQSHLCVAHALVTLLSVQVDQKLPQVFRADPKATFRR